MIVAAPSTSRIIDLRTRIAALHAHFAEVGRRAACAAADAAARGAPPSEKLLAELTGPGVQFQALRDEILDCAAALDIILPDTLRSLRDLTPVVDVLASTLSKRDG